MAVVWPSKNNFANGDVLTAANMNNIGDTLNVFNPTSATNGQIWVANGSASGSYQTVATGWTSIATYSTTGTGSFSLTSIPQTKTHLLILWDQTTGSSGTPTMRFNNSSSAVYNYSVIGQGATTITGAGNQTQFNFNSGWPDNCTSYLYIPFYTAVEDHNAICHTNSIAFLYFESAAAITRVDFTAGLAGTTNFTVYGI